MNADEINNFMLGKNVPRDMFVGEKLPNYLARKFKELEAENARLRQQRDAANAQLDFILENTKCDTVSEQNVSSQE